MAAIIYTDSRIYVLHLHGISKYLKGRVCVSVFILFGVFLIHSRYVSRNTRTVLYTELMN